MTTIFIAALALLALGVVIAAGLALFTAYTAKRIQQALPPQGRMVEAGGVRFHVEQQGTGPAVLLIHGLAGHTRHFTYGVAQRLAAQCHVVAIDRPGSGYSERSADTAADISTQAEAIAALMSRLQLEKAFVVGHSLGGAVALTLALEHPHCVSGLALVAPLTHLPEDAGVPAAFRALTISSAWLRTLFAWVLAVPASIAASKSVLEQVFGPEPVPRDFATRGGGLLSLRPSHFIAASRDMQAVPEVLPRISKRYGELRVPVHILFARKDRILDWRINGQGLADKLPHATLQVVDGGHMLPVTQPELTSSFILEAMRGVQRTELGAA